MTFANWGKCSSKNSFWKRRVLKKK
jgi:hypothetical protein